MKYITNHELVSVRNSTGREMHLCNRIKRLDNIISQFLDYMQVGRSVDETLYEVLKHTDIKEPELVQDYHFREDVVNYVLSEMEEME